MSGGRVTVLIENTAGGRGLLAEHGLAFWIEWGGKRLLFDTGQGYVLNHNAQQLGVPLVRVDAVVLSHGHYDHTGGLGEVLRTAQRPAVYAHPDVFAPKFARGLQGVVHEAGMPRLNEDEIRRQAELVTVEAPAEICPGLHVTGPVPRNADFEDTGGAFFKDRECTVPDPLTDDQAVFLDARAGIIVILGCAHAGVINTLRYIQDLTKGRPIHTVIGGMHLLHASRRRLDETVAALRHLGVQHVQPGHCTGFAAAARLWNDFPGRCTACPAGTVLELAG